MFDHLDRYKGEVNVGDVFRQKGYAYIFTGQIIRESLSTQNVWEMEIIDVQVIDPTPGRIKTAKAMLGKKQWIGRNTLANWEKVENTQTKEDILDLIELALATKDKEWFMELTEKLNEMEEKPCKQTSIC